jgi:hypothetical protein
MGVSNGDEDGGGIDGDSSGGNSLSWQGAGTETSVPRNWSSMAGCCGTFHGWMPNDLGFSRRRHFVGGRAMLEGTQGTHAIRWCGQGAHHPMVWPPLSPSPSLRGTPSSYREK